MILLVLFYYPIAIERFRDLLTFIATEMVFKGWNLANFDLKFQSLEGMVAQSDNKNPFKSFSAFIWYL